jgi:hypothetical protein
MNHPGFALLHLSPIVLLSLVFCVPSTWAQRTPPVKQILIQPAEPVVSLGALPEAQTRQYFFRKEAPLSFTSNLGLTEAQVRFIARGAGYDPVFPKNTPVVKLNAEANSWIASPPTRWLANVSDNEHSQTGLPHSLQYYGQRIPFAGQTIVHLARLANSHPRVPQILRLFIGSRNNTSSGAPRIRGHF